MLNIETKELKISDKLKRRIEMIGWFINTTPIINNGSIKNITGTNVAYVMPHIIVIKNNKYLMFDECDDVYVNTFKSNKLELGIVTINLSNIRNPDGTQLYKNIFKTSKVPT